MEEVEQGVASVVKRDAPEPPSPPPEFGSSAWVEQSLKESERLKKIISRSLQKHLLVLSGLEAAGNESKKGQEGRCGESSTPRDPPLASPPKHIEVGLNGSPGGVKRQTLAIRTRRVLAEVGMEGRRTSSFTVQ